MKLYLAGAISYNPEKAENDFNEAQKALEKAGYEIVNPFEIKNKGASYKELLKKDIQEMLPCAGVAVILNKEAVKSYGTIKELNIAIDYEIPIKTVEEWIEDKPFQWGNTSDTFYVVLETKEGYSFFLGDTSCKEIEERMNDKNRDFLMVSSRGSGVYFFKKEDIKVLQIS